MLFEAVSRVKLHYKFIHEPDSSDPPQLRRILTTVLEGINARQPVLPDGSGRALKLRLADRSEMKLSIHPGD